MAPNQEITNSPSLHYRSVRDYCRQKICRKWVIVSARFACSWHFKMVCGRKNGWGRKLERRKMDGGLTCSASNHLYWVTHKINLLEFCSGRTWFGWETDLTRLSKSAVGNRSEIILEVSCKKLSEHSETYACASQRSTGMM